MLEAPYDDGGILMPEEEYAPERRVMQSERLAIVETKVEGLKDDTGVIRSNIHAINEALQKVFILEERCERSLSQLLEITRDLPTIAASAQSFHTVKAQIENLVHESDQKKGAWRAVVMLASALVGAATVGGVIVAAMFGHLH